MRRGNLTSICTCLIAFTLTHSVFGGEPELERITKCWRNGDYAKVKEQILAFLEKNPASSMCGPLYALLGEIYLQECGYAKNPEQIVRQIELSLEQSEQDAFADQIEFIENAEKALELQPDLPESNILHLELYNAYLSLAEKEKDDELCDELLAEAANHLYDSEAWKNGSIKRENLVWLADHFKEQQDPCAEELLSALANMNEPTPAADPTPLFDVCQCDPGPSNARFTVRSRQPGGIGYPTGYTSFDLFYATGIRGNFSPFIDLRAHVFNNGKPAINAGLGLRYVPECDDTVFGINAYWDYRQAKHAAFNQIGLGLEALWSEWDAHLNAYAPLGYKRSYRTGFQGFKGNSAYFYKKYELAMWGGDLAVGYQLYNCGQFNLHATLDGYYFHGDYGKQAGGGFLRLRSIFNDFLSVEGQVSYDSLFKWNGQGELAISIPFGQPIKRYPRKTSCCDEILSIEKRLVEKPDRFEIMPTASHKTISKARAPITGQPLRFLFVDNTSSSAGTFESPYPTLAQAVAASLPGDVIYIFPGNGTSSGLTTSTILKDRQSLVGSGAPFEVATRFGNLVIPQLSDNLPLIQVNGAIAVIPISNNTISGLNIFDLSTSAVGNITQSVSNLSILKCDLTGDIDPTIYMGNPVRGSIKIEDNRISALSTLGTGCSLYSAGNDHVLISFRRNHLDKIQTYLVSLSVESTMNSSMQLFVENNEIRNAFVSGTELNITSANNSTLYASIRGNFIKSNNIGINLVSANNSRFDSVVELNQVSATTNGISLLSQNASRFTSRFTKNISSSPSQPIGFAQTGTSTLLVESPNGSISGVQNINTGQITTSGTIQFIQLQ